MESVPVITRDTKKEEIDDYAESFRKLCQQKEALLRTLGVSFMPEAVISVNTDANRFLVTAFHSGLVPTDDAATFMQAVEHNQSLFQLAYMLVLNDALSHAVSEAKQRKLSVLSDSGLIIPGRN